MDWGQSRRNADIVVRAFLASTVLFAALCGRAQPQTEHTSPTASKGPLEIDEVWIRASAKYNAARQNILVDVSRTISAGPYRPDWESLRKYETPDWYKDAKFGIFIHWGVYAVPAFGSEWYPRMMYQEGSSEFKHHLATYGPLTQFGYKDFIPRFKAEKFNPEEWAQLFEEAGAKYVVPVFEHHDGFAMYDSGLSDWTVVKKGPQRDVYGELAKAVRARGLHLGASSHRIEHDFFLDGGRRIASDVNDPVYAAFYGPAHAWLESKTSLLDDWTYVSNAYLDDWLARSAEIVEKYDPEVLYFDWWIGQPDARRHVAKFASYYYNHAASRDKVPVMLYKSNAMQEHSAVLDVERGQFADTRPLYWQTDTSISNQSWGFIENDSYKPAQVILWQLIDVVSKNGNLLVNIGPRADGTIPEQAQITLREIGAWLKMYGEAIYGTRPWEKCCEGPTTIVAGQFHDAETRPYTEHDFRFTTKKHSLYVIGMEWPGSGTAVVRALKADTFSGHKIVSVSLLGHEGELHYEWKEDELHISLPGSIPAAGARGSYAIKIELEGH